MTPIDPTEMMRRSLIESGEMTTRLDEIIESGGPVYDTGELQEAFEVLSFLAPFVMVRRRSDGVRGTLTFTSRPRFYFDFQEG